MALTQEDRAAIRAVVEKDADVVRRRDWDAAVRMFTTDAVRFPPNQPPIKGRAAMRAWLDTFPPIEAFTLTVHEIVGHDDLAFVRGAYALTIAPSGDAAPITDRGHYMGLLRKQPDGSWLWATDMIASEVAQT